MRRRTVAAVVLSVALLGVVGIVVTGQHQGAPSAPADRSAEQTPLAVASGTGCLEDGVRDAGGWIHTVADGRSDALTMNATVVHDPGERATVSLATRHDGYVVRIHTDDEALPTRNRSMPTPTFERRNCTVATQIDAGARLRSDRDRITVVANGREIDSFSQEGTTMGRLFPLPNPIYLENETASSLEGQMTR